MADSGNKRINYYGIRTDHHGYGEVNQMSSFGTLVFERPMGIAHDVDRNTLIVTDPGRRRITFHDFTNQQMLRSVDQRSAGTDMRQPQDVAIDNYGRAFVTDQEMNAIYCFEGTGKFLFKFGAGELAQPWGICLGRQKEYLYVADKGNNRVLKYSPEGVLIKEVAKFTRPKGLTVTVQGNLITTTEDPLAFVKMVGFKVLAKD